MRIPSNAAARGIQCVQTGWCREPQNAVGVLANLNHMRNRIASEGFSLGIEPVQILMAGDPERPVAILKQGIYVRTTDTLGIPGIVNEHLEGVAVEWVKAVGRTEPNKPLIILCKRPSVRLGRAFNGVEAGEANIRAIDHREADSPRVYTRLGNVVFPDWLISSPAVSTRAETNRRI